MVGKMHMLDATISDVFKIGGWVGHESTIFEVI